jgi:hypothetical protein
MRFTLQVDPDTASRRRTLDALVSGHDTNDVEDRSTSCKRHTDHAERRVGRHVVQSDS